MEDKARGVGSRFIVSLSKNAHVYWRDPVIQDPEEWNFPPSRSLIFDSHATYVRVCIL